MEKTRKLQGSQPVETLEVVKRLLLGRPSNFDDCVEWARKYWQEMFHNQIAQLLHNFPADQLTSSGQPFWSGPKVRIPVINIIVHQGFALSYITTSLNLLFIYNLQRCPKPLNFDASCPLHMDFIVAAANLRATVYNIACCKDREVIARILTTIEPTIPKFQPKGTFIT